MKLKIFITLLTVLFVHSSGFGQIPQTISYQGILTDNSGQPVANGNYALTFKIYDQPTAGRLNWSEVQTTAIQDGIFNVILGKVNPLALSFDKPYWLGITVDTGAELAPRIELTASAYSLNAQAVMDSAITSRKIAARQVVRSINSLKDHVTLKAGANVTISKAGDTLTIASTAPATGNTLDQAYDQGGAGAGRTIVADAGAVNIAGPDGLTVNGKVGIGTTTPTEQLTVNGTIESKTGGFKFPDGTIQTSATTAGNSWSLIGNSGTTAGVNFIGTTDNQPLEFKVYNKRVLRIEPKSWGQVNIIAGNRNNNVISGVQSATISGGGQDMEPNIVTDNYGTIGGGCKNQAGDNAGDTQDHSCTTVAGGYGNMATGRSAAIAGGEVNSCSNSYTFIGGGSFNTASGAYATIPGGEYNTAAGEYSFAAGRRARARHDGTFVWADARSDSFASTNANQFLIRASGGVGIGLNNPAHKLDVAGTVQMTGFKMPTGANNGYLLTSDANGVGTWQPAPATGIGGSGTTGYIPKFLSDTSLGNSLLFETDGKIGIGTAVPEAFLDVDALRSTFAEDFKLAQFTHRIPTGRTIDLTINYLGATIGDGTLAFREDRAEKDFLVVNLLTPQNKIYFPNGNIGIGTTHPSHKFHVVAEDAVGLFESTGNVAYLRLTTNEGMNNRVEFKNLPGGNLSLWTAGGYDVFNITRSGKVGIGTTTPNSDSKLHVATDGKYAGYLTSTNLNSDTHIIHAEYTGSAGNSNPVAVYGKSVPQDFNGYGGYFEGGIRGVYGTVLPTGNKSYYGVYGYISGGTGTNYGIRGYSFGGTGSTGTNYGVFGSVGGSGTNYGVYGSAGGSGSYYAVYASGDLAYTGNLIHVSDVKFKEHIRPLTGVISKIKLLESREFEYTNNPEYHHLNLAAGKQYGLVAQELEKVFPELVVDAIHPPADEEDGKKGEPIHYKGIKYIELIPILLQAAKEQQQLIENLQTMLEQQQQTIDELKAQILKSK